MARKKQTSQGENTEKKSTKDTKKTLKQNKKERNKARAKIKLPGTFKLMCLGLAYLKPVTKYILILITAHLILAYFLIVKTEVSAATIQFGLFVMLIVSLVYIWFLREAAQKKPQLNFQMAVYRGPAQIVPFLLLILLGAVQLLPFAIGAWIYQIAIGGEIAIFYWEKLSFAGLWFLLSLPSVFWLSATSIALLLVAIPGVVPLEAWRAGKQLTSGFIKKIMWRFFAFTAIIFAVLVGVVLFFVHFEWFVLALKSPSFMLIILLPFIWAYLFALYQELLRHA